MEERIKSIEKHVKVINDEMGSLDNRQRETKSSVDNILGQLKWISYIIIGTFLAAVIDLIRGFLSG
ncbi:hypothetical protein LCGC14_1929780 [marine sediment metagenome]|uniref:Uncharacterized protein n=1 Tax=marine sediment metagenome TaxID=412755 RepID=A0A0F9FNX8_9ZZZZ